MKIVMLGPGYGHNIEPYLDYFNDRSLEYKLIFIYWGRLDFDQKYKNITYVKFSPANVIHMYRHINNRDVSFIWQHGNNIIIYLLMSILKKKSTVHFLNIWSDRLFLALENSRLKNIIANIVLRKSYIHCYWYTTSQNIKSKIPSATVHTIDCGMHDDLFETHSKDCISSAFKGLIDCVDQLDGKKFFYPKSMTDASGHLLILEASKKLIDEGVTNFKVIFRRGNEINNEYEIAIKQYISSNEMDDYIVMQPYSYLSFAELSLLWREMDCGLQIAYHDQLSTTFLEPMLFEKEIIASNIESYRIYKDRFNVEIDLCELDQESIAGAMKKVCRGDDTSSETLRQRRRVVESNFKFKSNVQRIIEHYASL